MPPKKVKSSKDELPKASSKVAASKASKTASKAKAPKSTKTSKASKTTSTAAALATSASATVAQPVLNPDRDFRRRTRANPSPSLKERSGLEKEPSFKKPTIARTAISNAAARRDQEAEESTQQESVSASHSSEPEESRSTSPELASLHSHPWSPSSSRMPGAFTTVEPSSHQAAGSSKATPRIAKRSRPEVSDASEADTEDASPSRPAKRVRTDATPKLHNDTPFEYFGLDHAIDPVQQQLALEIEAAPTSPSNIQEDTVGEQQPASTPSFFSVTNKDESTYYTPQNVEAAQATAFSQATKVAEATEVFQAPEAGQTTAESQAIKLAEVFSVPEVIVHQTIAETHEPGVVAGDQPISMISDVPAQSSVNNRASASKSAAKSTSHSALSSSRSAARSASRSANKCAIESPSNARVPRAYSRRSSPDLLREEMMRRRDRRLEKSKAQPPRQRKSIDKIHISDMSSDSEELVPYNAADMRFVKENTKRMLSIYESEKIHKESLYVLRPDLEAKHGKMSRPRKQGGVPSAMRHRKKQSPTSVISIHVQTQNGAELFDVAPKDSEILLNIHRLLTVNPGLLTADEALAGLQSAMDAKKAQLAPNTSIVGNGGMASTQSQSMTVFDPASSAINPNNTSSPPPEVQNNNTDHIINNTSASIPEDQTNSNDHMTNMGNSDVRNQREVNAASASPYPKQDNTAKLHTEDLESHSAQPSPEGWAFSTMSAIKSVVSKPFEYFGGASAAGPSTANDQDFFSPLKVPSTPTPAPRVKRSFAALFNPSRRDKGKGKASALDDRTTEFQAHAHNMKNKHRKSVAASTDGLDLPHRKRIYHTKPLPLYKGPPTKNTFTVPETTDDDDDDDEEEAEEVSAPVETVAEASENTNTNDKYPIDTINQNNPIDLFNQNNPIDTMHHNNPIDIFNQNNPIDTMNHNNPIDTMNQNTMYQPKLRLPPPPKPTGLHAHWNRLNHTWAENSERKREIYEVNSEMFNSRDRRRREDPEKYRQWVENIPDDLNYWIRALRQRWTVTELWDKYNLIDYARQDPYRFLRLACLNEEGNKNVSCSDYGVTDDDREHLAIWHTRRGTVGRFQKEAAAREEEAAKKASEQEANEKEASEKEASAKEAGTREEQAAKEAIAKEANEKEASANVFSLMRQSQEDFVIFDNVRECEAAQQQKWANLGSLVV
ncbi:uncharacterized protein RCO7_10646 [Rhynchosporium graminicola]|uniref:Uncharacterized protein n=1 Tax=Rhynchosporium graminicola TaxID=2792576 RepID=A0A1E1L147_9HELO|nr:uncharacterized protein RCO7_10646 [Rhynchosporium commune]